MRCKHRETSHNEHAYCGLKLKFHFSSGSSDPVLEQPARNSQNRRDRQPIERRMQRRNPHKPSAPTTWHQVPEQTCAIRRPRSGGTGSS